MTEYRHFFVSNENNNRVGKFDVQSKAGRKRLSERLADDLSIDPIRIPEHAENHEQAIQNLTKNTVEWDDRILSGGQS